MPQVNVREVSLNAIFFGDTSAHNGSAVSISDAIDYMLEITNSLNQAGNVQIQWSIDNTNWNNLGSAVAAAATTNLVAAIAAPRPFYGWLRANYTATVSPASGTLTVAFHKQYM